MRAFVDSLREEIEVAQIVIIRRDAGFLISHREDRAIPVDRLKSLDLSELLKQVQHTESGAFRPLRSAPNLSRGWCFGARDETELELALNYLYPGFLADWWAVQSGSAHVTHYREFAGRQTGMYRITTMLDSRGASQVIRATCHRAHCLKQRLWTVEGLEPDGPLEKSVIPCLEPCAILLEFARRAVRIQQEEEGKPDPQTPDATALAEALERALANPDPSIREADFANPLNPRRLRLALEKLKDGEAAGL